MQSCCFVMIAITKMLFSTATSNIDWPYITTINKGVRFDPSILMEGFIMSWQIDNIPEQLNGNEVYEHLYEKAIRCYSSYCFAVKNLHDEQRNHAKGSKANSLLYATNDFCRYSSELNTMLDVLTAIVLGRVIDYFDDDYLHAESYVKLAIVTDAESIYPILADMREEVCW